MPSLLIIRLHPVEPIAGDAFTNYLTGLTIAAHEVSFNDSGGTGPAFGTVAYQAPTLPLSPSINPIPGPYPANTGIVQHFDLPVISISPPLKKRNFKAVATSVIVIPTPPPGGEFGTADIRLVITRGANEIVHKQIYYNVPVAAAPVPADPNAFPGLQPISLHLALPSPGQQIGTSVTVPEDGTAPNFANLRTAVEAVLTAEPGNTAVINNLTRSQSHHIAYEIIWDRMAYPLPVPTRSLEEMYTGPHSASSDEERDRRLFEGDLMTYYVKHNNEAERLANFIFSLSAAIWCEQQSANATDVGFYFPIIPTELTREAKLILKGSGAILDPKFTVPAAYFYALTAILPPQVGREDRLKITILNAEKQLIASIEQAIDDQVLSEPAGVNRFQAARRLRALGLIGEVGTPVCVVAPATPLHGLLTNWLAVTTANTDAFWAGLSNPDKTGHLELILCAIAEAHTPLIAAIKAPPFSVNNLATLLAKNNTDWEALLSATPALLPEFTKPGTVDERIQAFIRHLRRFFDVLNLVGPAPIPIVGAAPVLDRSTNPIDLLLATYPGGFSFSGWNAATLATTLKSIFPGDTAAQEQFTDWLLCLQGVIDLTNGIVPEPVRFSIMEALWARGFTNADSLQGFTFEEFNDALIGSVAYEHTYANTIWSNAGVTPPNPVPGPAGFKPVNPDGSLVNCVPPAYRSPLGPVAYLHDLLEVSDKMTCDTLQPTNAKTTLAALLASRRGPLGTLLATKANLEVPIPLLDIVNESLEHMVADDVASGMVYNTSSDQVGSHELTSNPAPTPNVFLHDPETLLEALPEHATPATPTDEQTAYDKLKKDFSACNLPYSQSLDVVRTYLGQLGTSRFATMRRFRKTITEFVLDPTHQPAAFQDHLWRYPVRIDTAIEYLKLTPEEYNTLFQNTTIVTPAAARRRGRRPTVSDGTPGENPLSLLPTLIKPPLSAVGQPQPGGVVTVVDFLNYTCLTYCEFIELWQSKFVVFNSKDNPEQGFPPCEPCCLDPYQIVFEDPADPEQALRELIIFIRLWRKLQALPTARYTFDQLHSICDVLKLFIGNSVNPDFIRQLVAFQMLSDNLEPNATPAHHLRLLTLWNSAAAIPEFDEIIRYVLDQIQQYAVHVHGCGCRQPEFIKLLFENLDTLSELAGFNPSNPAYAWHTLPTHTLRFVEILSKIYASDFSVGELLFLFTNDDHLQGDDPFALQSSNEARDFSFSLPDDEEQYSLLTLRKKLREVREDTPTNEETDEAAGHWTWARIETTLRNEFGLELVHWQSLGHHFFPTQLTNSGVPVSSIQRQYRVPLGASPERMWNTPPNGPFQYDAFTQELGTQVPLMDEAVLAKLSRIRQLTAPEQQAVRDLYFLPRVDLAYFAYLFDNFGEAEVHLLQEPDEAKRWAWFQQQFATFYRCCQLIGEHLAAHVALVTGSPNPEGAELAKLLLQKLWADENKATSSWEDDSGVPPAVTWHPQAHGGAFAALLGLTGTGMLAEYRDADQDLRWREVRGGLDAFGLHKNTFNTPVPTVIPNMDFAISAEQRRFVEVRNGFVMTNPKGTVLGGAEPFSLRWKGLLLIEKEGEYGFSAGASTPSGELPDFEKIDQSHRWRVVLRRGQKMWVLLSHDWPSEEAPASCAKPVSLRQGFYELTIDLERKPLFFDGPEDICPQLTGFQLKYNGPDADNAWAAIPNNKLFVGQKDDTLQNGINLPGAAEDFLVAHFTSTVRDIRRTYQRAFKALLFVSRFRLSAQKAADDGQSELGYMLSQPEHFAGQSYYLNGPAPFETHKAYFDPNFLPVGDNYATPSAAQDQRVSPTSQRKQALFDWWERLFDYTVMRREAARSPEQPAWLLFHESSEVHPDNPADLVRHLGIDLRHDTLVLQYYLDYRVTSFDLMDDRWAVRVWHSEKWIRTLLAHFYEKNIRDARPDLWASNDPSVAENAFGVVESGNHNLTKFYRDGCIENGEPRRYEEIKRLNDGLRQRGRAALVAYLTHQNRVTLPWGGFATEARQLSELLLIDVETGLCQKASRIEEAITAIQLYVQRARLGLEKNLPVSSAFLLGWDRHFASFRVWEACKRQTIYRENWIEWDDLKIAKKSEAFQFLEAELRQATLTMPVPGGLAYWNGKRPPAHSGITLLQHREPATIQLLNPLPPMPEGLGLMGTPDRHARPNWLAPVLVESRGQTTPPPNGNNNPPILRSVLPVAAAATAPIGGQKPNLADLPLWLQAAVRLGTKFIRVAAAGIPPATTTFDPKCASSAEATCCSECGKNHPALMDEYYFWIERSSHYEKAEQIAEWGAVATDPHSDWHRPDKLPGLLHWPDKPMVHLRWCRVHNGEFQQPRQSSEGVWLVSGSNPELDFSGREGDSLQFTVVGGAAPLGYVSPPPPGFRYDLAIDDALVVPQVAAAPVPVLVGGLAAFPFFALFDPGAPVLPRSLFSTALAVANHLRAHCHFEEALHWYELVYNPLNNDNTWMDCQPSPSDNPNNPDNPDNPNNPDNPVPIGRELPIDPATGSVVAPAADPTRDCCCASEPVSDAEVKERAMLLNYVDTLLTWGDALMRKNTPESFQQARLIFDMVAKILGTTPVTVMGSDLTAALVPVSQFEPDCAPINPRLLCLYTTTADRLALIHSCLNAKRLKNGRPNLDMPYFGNSDIRDCWKTTLDTCADENDWCAPQSPYRFMVLIQKVQEITNDVRAFGGALLAAFEKGDAEYLSTIRVRHERQLLTLALDVRQHQWRQADWQVQALHKTKEIAQTNLNYYKNLISNGLISNESQYEPLIITSTTLRSAGNIAEAIGQAVNLVPDLFVGFPANFVKLPPGTKLSMIFSASGKIANTAADIVSTVGALGLVKAGWERREQEWNHQVDILTIEIEQIERQILAAERARDLALRELDNQQQQIENSVEVHDFLRDKFTNHALYLWMQQETAALYYRMYEMALHCARQAQRAFNFERGYSARRFIPSEIWDNLHEGLLAGERLQVAVKQMEKSYYDENVREYELTKHISLRLHFPMAFLQLQTTGYCEIELPEWLFDLDYPGHYMRRIKNISMTLPCVTGPYTGVHCRLTLLSSKVRVDPRLMKQPHSCCQDDRWKNGYQAMPDDPRLISLYAATEAIATSSGQNDSGLFELNFRDERYLPFEFAGAVSRWRIELPLENNQFDMKTLSDCILHLNFTAREGGENLRRVANESAQQNLPGGGIRFFDVRHELPEAWQQFIGSPIEDRTAQQLGVRLSRTMFPYLTGHKRIGIKRLEILFEATGAVPSNHHIVEFLVGQRHGFKEEKCDCDVYSVTCVASDYWPGFFHGIIDHNFELLRQSERQDLGVFRFPHHVGPITNAYLFCGYEVV